MRVTTLGIDQGVRGFIFNQARENLWRVASFYELDDLVQDGFMCWVRIVRRYPDVRTTKRRMPLFKTAFINHIHNLARTKSRRVELVNAASLEIGAFEAMCEQADASADPDIGFIITQLPQAILAVVLRMIDGTEPYRRHIDGTRETSNERYCRIAGLPPTTQFDQYVLQYLHGA